MHARECLILFHFGLIIFILKFLLLQHSNLLLIFTTSFNAGPKPLDADALNATRRINARDDARELMQDAATRASQKKDNQTYLSSRLIFMSCNRQKMQNPFWKPIEVLEPNILVWMGDIIYGDFIGQFANVPLALLKYFLLCPINTLRALLLRSAPLYPCATPSTIRDSYNETLNNPEYRQILAGKQLELVAGIYDDHDYGENNGDKTFEHKRLSKQYLLDFLNTPPDDPRRSTSTEGANAVHYIEHSLSSGRVFKTAIILLDTRYNKDPYTVDPASGDFLGSSQWTWLETVLGTSDADVHVIVSSVQVLVERPLIETWNLFPNARRRLLNTVLRSRAKNPIFLSGDVHFAEISTAVCRPENKGAAGDKTSLLPQEIQLWEFTSSGMTHSVRRTLKGATGTYVDLVLRWILPTDHTDVRAVDGLKQIYTGRNIGVLDMLIDQSSTGDNNDSILSFKILNSKMQIVLSKDLIMSSGSNWASTEKKPAINPANNISDASFSQQWKSVNWDCTHLKVPQPATTRHIQNRVVVALLSLWLVAAIVISLILFVTKFLCKVLKWAKQLKGRSRSRKTD